MGESSAPRRPTHDTNTSRRQVNTQTHTHINNNTNNTSSKQSKYKHTMKFTGLIASTLMLLLAVMASTASARSIAFPDPHSHVCPQKKQCCRAFTLECQACDADLSEEEFCRRNPHSHVCPQKPTKPSHPDNCYSKIWNKEVLQVRRLEEEVQVREENISS